MWTLWFVLGGAALIVLLVCIGYALPQNHTASRTLRLKQSPEAVWQALTDYAAQPQWRAELKKIEKQPDSNGRETWKEYNAMGEMTLITIEAAAPRKLVRQIGPGLAFGGAWIYEITPDGSGSKLKITENGEVYNPVFRVVGKFMDPTASMTAFMTGLAKKFGETPAFE